jgi:hypothetical protein
MIIKKYQIFENIQLADKIYFKPGVLNDEDKEIILKVAKNSHYIKPLCDIYLQLKELNMISSLNDYYHRLTNYDNNYFPIKNFNINDLTDIPVEIFLKSVVKNDVSSFSVIK